MVGGKIDQFHIELEGPRDVHWRGPSELSSLVGGNEGGAGSAIDLSKAALTLSDSPQVVRTTGRVRVGSVDRNWLLHPVTDWTFDLRKPFRLVPTVAPEVHLVYEPEEADLFRQGLTVSPPRKGQRGIITTASVKVHGIPDYASFAVLIRPAGRKELPVGSCACSPDQPRYFALPGWPAAMIDNPVDVIFRSDPTIAAAVGLTRAWEGEIVIHNVR